MVGIILASGLSKRFGNNKLLEFINGKPMVYYVLKAAKESSLEKIVLIYKDNDVKDIAKQFPIHCILNKKYTLGQSEGIKIGVKAYCSEDSFMFIMADQPFLTSKTINKLIEKFKKKDKIIVPKYKDRNGSPVIFPKRFIKDLLNLHGDVGGKEIIKKNPLEVEFCHLNNEKELLDIDNKETLKNLFKQGEKI